MLSNPYFIAIGIPLTLILSGVFAKKLVRGTSWIRSDFFLGVELSLSAMSAALVFLFDIATNSSDQNPENQKDLAATGGFIALSFFLLLLVMSTHQDWEPQNNKPAKQIGWLGFFSNGIGAGLLVAFVLLVKGVALL